MPIDGPGPFTPVGPTAASPPPPPPPPPPPAQALPVAPEMAQDVAGAIAKIVAPGGAPDGFDQEGGTSVAEAVAKSAFEAALGMGGEPDGGSAAAAVASDEASAPPPDARDASTFGDYQQKQEQPNACGTTSEAMVLSFLAGKPGAFDQKAIDQDIRQADLFTLPNHIADFARDHGFRASVVNDASVGDLKGMLDQGVPVQVLYDPYGEKPDQAAQYLHYAVVTGYDADDQGQVKSLKIADPEDPTKQETVSVEDFQKRWGNLKIPYGPKPDSGLNNVMIPMLPNDNVPIKGRDGTVRSSNDIALPPENTNRVVDLFSDAWSLTNKAGQVIDQVEEQAEGAKDWAKDHIPGASSLPFLG